MKRFLIGFGVLLFLTGVASAERPLSDAQLEKITAGASGLPSFSNILASVPASLLSNALSTTSSSASSTPNLDSSTSAFDLGEAGITGAARLGEYLGVVQFLGPQ
jgi:hypothetical protein